MTTIEIYVTPFYNSEGPQIDIGPFSEGLATTDEATFVSTIHKMKVAWNKLNFVEMYVAAIRLYDHGFRKESVYWFYSAQYRARLFSAVLGESQVGGMGAPGFELASAAGAFHQLAGPYINGYAFGDLKHLTNVLQQVVREGASVPDFKAMHPRVAFKDNSDWEKLNRVVGEGLGQMIGMLKEQGGEISRQRVETGAAAQFDKLPDKPLPA